MFGDDMPRHTSDGVEIRNGMYLFNTLDQEPVTTTTGTGCGKHHTSFRQPDADGITRPTKSVHRDGTVRYVNVWEGYHHCRVRSDQAGACRYVHASELRQEL